jgi:hypothetical protein
MDGPDDEIRAMATTTTDPRSLDSEAMYELIQPFSEAAFAKPNGHDRSAEAGQWSETVSPFTEAPDRSSSESEAERLMSEALDELRDEGFDEAVANLAEETEQVIGDRFSNESASSASERERYGDAHLANVRFESHQYLEALEAGLQGLSLESLNEQQLDEVLDRLDPETRDLTPAGEEFVGSLIKKAKKAVKFVANTAKTIHGKVAGVVLGPVLKKLRGLINPLLRRVLSFAIGRLPAALQPAARTLASKFKAEAEAEGEEFADEAPMSPANLTDVEALTDSFDEALAEAAMNLSDEGFDNESLEGLDQLDSEGTDGRQLEALAEARGELIDRLSAADESEDLAPVVEQFVPAILGALRLGISLIGRPKVVGFLAKYLGQLIQKWVGPAQSGPLSNAIADTGLRLATLEAESGEASDSREAEGPIALASVIEDTVRKLAESEDYVFENEDLMQLAAAEAFGQAVATHFPSQLVRPALQQAPSLGGTFVTRRPRSVRRYFKYTRTPDVEVTAQVADAIPTFGGSTLGAVLRASGANFPVRARMHIYQAAVGTTLPRMMRVDRRQLRGRRFGRAATAHPLTPAAAGLLLREPALGVAVPARFMRSRHRIAAGQRFFHLEPTGAASMLALQEAGTPRPAAPTRAWTVVNLRKARVTVGFYLSETESQTLVTAIRGGRGGAALLQALMAAYKGEGSGSGKGRVRILREDGEDFEDFAGRLGKVASGLNGSLRKRLRSWVLPALAAWVRTNAEAFARAAAAPEDGVTIRVRLTGVPGLDLIGRLPGKPGLPAPSMPRIPRATPSINITVTPGGPKR